MASHKDSGRDRNAGRKARDRRRQVLPIMEHLEDRRLLAVAGSLPPTWVPTSTNLDDPHNGPLAKAGSDLVNMYHDYSTALADGQAFSFTAAEAKQFYTQGSMIDVDINVYGNLVAYGKQVQGLGMEVGAVDSTTGTIEGGIPINQLPAIVGLSGTVGMLPVYRASFYSVGVATDQGETALLADKAKSEFNVDGTGVTVGVLSDSANQYNGGLAASYKTGDLSAANPVTILNDGPAGSDDEGRAMLEEIHDIATGSKLLFDTAESTNPLLSGEMVFAQHIRDLAAAGANVITDDVGYPTEPFYQDGIVATAVNDVSAAGVTYLGAVGNSADSGYSSLFRGANGTVPGVGTGRFQNFNPGAGAAALTIGINVYNPSNLILQWDNPFYSTNGVTTELDIYVLDANNNIVSSSTLNAIANQTPFQFAAGVPVGQYKVAVEVAAGSPDPGRLAFYDHGSGGFSVDHQYGSAGGTSYPTAAGHAEATGAISVGAVPWFNAPAFDPGLPQYNNEPFSSMGPDTVVFAANGARLPVPQVRAKPDISSVDGIDTSFFIPNFFLQTTNPPFPQSAYPPYPGQASTVTGEKPTPSELDGNTNPNFFGTSAAAPNLAAVTALMKQLNPAVTNAEILAAYQSTAIPLNGQSAGQYNTQAGFGLAQAPQALDAINTFHVASTSPANAQGLTVPPQYLIVTLNRDIDVRTLNANSLKFTAYSVPGLTITAGTPLVDLNNLRVLYYPLTFNLTPGFKGSGAYAYSIVPGSMLSTDGKPLQGFNGSFGVFDNIAPRVTGTSVLGRIVDVTFSEPINPASLNKNDFYLIRTGGVNVPFGSPLNVVVNQDPRLKIGYDAATNTAVLDFSALDQSELPSDHYGLVVLDSVTDVVGNRLDGEFNGLFPSGNGQEGGNFTQDLGVRGLTAPQILSLGIDPSSDSGIVGDQNTNTVRPLFSGQVSAQFPTAAAGLTVVAEFNGVRGGTLDLGQGVGGRGFTGGFDVQTVTDSSGHFSFRAPFDLPEGFQTVRVVVIGATDLPPLPGLSSLRDAAFRIDDNAPILVTDPNSIQQLSRVSSLTSVTIDAVDPVIPSDLGNPLAVPTQFIVPALNPSTASNISNYSLINLGSDNAPGGTGTAADTDYSSFITSAAYVDTSKRLTTADPYTGNITLTFAPGLPSGRYEIIAHRATPLTPGVTDAAGNGIFINTPTGVAAQDFILTVDLQPTPAYITSVQAVTPDPNGASLDPDTTATPQGTVDLSGPRSYFELPVPGVAARATAPPTEFAIDFSNPLDPTKDYTNFVQLIASANTPTSAPDGDFGTDPTYQSGVGYTRVPNTTVKLINSVLGATFGQPGYKNRLLLSLPAGTTLAADHYRLYIPNAIRNDGTDLRIVDQFGNQLDGEFLGNLSPNGDGTYQDLLPTGQMRPNDLTGDGVPGGAFETGYTVVPNGNVIFARPDYTEDPNLPDTAADGSPQKPYSALAPEAVPDLANGGDLNATSNFTDPVQAPYDRNGNGHFDRSAFVAAAALSAKGPVVIVAEPSVNVAADTFVLQAPSGTDPVLNDGSASVPFDTTLVMEPSTIVKMRNASLFVQNQGSALQVLGGANPQNQVIFTSLSDDTAGGDTNNDGNSSAPTGGDWGGIVFRNFDDTSNGGRPIPVAPGPQDALRPKLGVSGADETLSIIDHAQIRYAGGAVPQTIGYRFDAITNFNARPVITNVTISQTGGNNSAQAAISGDVDSFREDDLARGILVRQATLQDNSINGIYVRAELNGVAEPTDAVAHPDNPISLGGTQNYTFFAPVPYVLVSRLVIGQALVEDQNGLTQFVGDRFYFQPGTVMKFQRGAAIDEIMPPANQTPARLPSLNIGDRTYINEYDANNNISPTDPGFRAPTTGDAQVLFTSFFDDKATTGYRDPNTGVVTPIVAPINSDNGDGSNQPMPGVFPIPTAARWGGISVIAGALAVIDEATFEYGGGSVNNALGTIPQRDVLAFQNAQLSALTSNPRGTRAYITNNNFFDNLQAPMSIDPNGLLATDPLRPLVSGNPFFRGNVMLRNQLNGLEVLPEVANDGPQGNLSDVAGQTANVFTNTIWDDTDLTYILRATIRLGGSELGKFNNFAGPLPPMPTGGSFLPELTPSITLTVQSSLPGTLLANGDTVARPGESAIIKLLNNPNVGPVGDGLNGMPAGNAQSDFAGGAGFIAGADDGVDPPADPLIDSGYLSQMRFLGIGGNQTTGQQRVPVILTSVRDDTVGRTVRGVPQFQASFGNTTAPAPGDGGIIDFGALGLSDYNLLDPRDGSLIDNVDLKYMTRVEQQGGGWVYSTGNNLTDKIGARPDIQYNTAKAMTVSDSNFSYFSQVDFIAHPSGVAMLDAPLIARDTVGLHGQPTLTFFVNDTFSNSPQGVRIDGEQVQSDAVPQESPSEAILLNNTFYNDGDALHLESALPTGINPLAHVQVLAMDNIFANSTANAINVNGQSYGSQGQYNLFSNNAADVTVTGGGSFSNNQPVSGLPQFRNAAAGDFSLLPNSAAIDASRSEIGPLPLGNSLQPIAVLAPDASNGLRNATGRTNPIGGLTTAAKPGDIISLPGYNLRNYDDEFVPAIPGTPGALSGPTSNAGNPFSYTPIQGERDQAGQLRVDDPNVANVGFGSRPFFDIGAYEYVQLNPPHVLTVTAIINNPTISPTNPVGPLNPPTVQVPFYAAGTTVGENQTPSQIIIQFDQQLDPSTVNNKTITLTASGGDGIFDNGNDKQIDLAGKLTYDPTRRIIIIALPAGFLASDVYRLEVFGSGGNVIRNPQGLALDGENTVGDQPNAATLPLPSGDGFPGGNFFLPFVIDTHPPAIVAGSLNLDPSTVTGAAKNVTDDNRPNFIGTVTDVAPPANYLQNQTVFIDVSTKGNGVYDRLGVATGKTDINGNFTATFDPNQAPLSDSPYNVGPDGILGTADDTGYSMARVRIVDQSGNVSNLTDPNALISFVIDTKGPRVTAADPLPGSQALSSTGVIPVSIAFNENINPATINANTIIVTRAGGDGIFGNGNDAPVAIDTSSIQLQNLMSPTGAEILHFNITGATFNDVYQVTLKGSGSAITDIAGNDLDGEFNGVFPSGDGNPGGDFNLQFIVFNPINAANVFVGGGASNPSAIMGTRENPFTTISAAIAAATPGDTIGVLPGVYTESITLKSLVRVVSASPSSTDGIVVPGSALQTIIRAPANGSAATTTVTGTNLASIPAFSTELSGFTIASPLVGDSARGPINPGSFGVLLTNSDVLIDKNYVIDSNVGVGVNYGGSNALVPRIESNGLIGNAVGLLLNGMSTTTFASNHDVEVANNDIAFNTYGIFSQTNDAGGPTLATVVNNIIWENADHSGKRQGTGIITNTPGRLSVLDNLFQGNGPSDSSPADDTIGVGGGFNPALLTPKGDAFGNFTGNPAFIAPIDPRPDGSGPGNFFLGANYDLQSYSAAIDAAINADAPVRDFLNRTRVAIAGHNRPGYGPADVGAFEYNGGSGGGLVTRDIIATGSGAPPASAFAATGATVVVNTPASNAAATKPTKSVKTHRVAPKVSTPFAAARRFFHKNGK